MKIFIATLTVNCSIPKDMLLEKQIFMLYNFNMKSNKQKELKYSKRKNECEFREILLDIKTKEKKRSSSKFSIFSKKNVI